MLRRLMSMLLLVVLLSSTVSALSGCVVLPYDEGYHGGYWEHRDHDHRHW